MNITFAFLCLLFEKLSLASTARFFAVLLFLTNLFGNIQPSEKTGECFFERQTTSAQLIAQSNGLDAILLFSTLYLTSF